jgi:4-methyl-5(b-hydroxyethyl)-thiazole monophosphate biosynthesis
MPKVYAFLADGFEEVEGLAVIDLLRRGKIETIMVSIMDDIYVTGAHNMVIKADKKLNEVNTEDGDMVFLPGGGAGTENLYACEELKMIIRKYNEEGKRLSAICAAPSVYGRMGLLKGKKATCYPGFEEQLIGATVLTDKVVTDGKFTTAKGLGAALELGFELINVLENEELSKNIAKQIQYI